MERPPDAITMIASELLATTGIEWAVPAVEGVLQSADEEYPLSTQQVVPLLAAAFLLFGGYILYAERAPFLRARTYLSVPSFDPHASLDEDGPVAVEGTVVPAEETVTAPVTGEECVAYRHAEQKLVHDRRSRSRREKERARRAGHSGRGTKAVREWSTVESERDRVPFRVETEAGPVDVDPDGARIDVPSRTVDGPSLFGRVLAYVPVVRFFTGLEREVESVLETGDRVLVVGDVDRPDSEDAVGAVTGGEDAAPLVTSKSRRKLATRNLASGLYNSLMAFLLFGMAVATVVVAVEMGVYG